MAKKPTTKRNRRPARSTKPPATPHQAPKAMDYAAAFDWPGYFNAVANKPARETLVKALDLFEAADKHAKPSKRPPQRIAIDIGCGEGRDTRELLRRGGPVRWSLMATDGSSKGLDILLDSLRPSEHKRLYVARCGMEELPRRYPLARGGIRHGLSERRATQVDLINASFSLPFCEKRALLPLWRWITALIRPGGRFAGQIFGDRDTWAHVRKTTGITRNTMNHMFKDFVFEELREEEKDDVTTMGEPKHWHVFHIVARKRK